MKVVEKFLIGLLSLNLGIITGVLIFRSIYNVSASATTEKESTVELYRDDTLDEEDFEPKDAAAAYDVVISPILAETTTVQAQAASKPIISSANASSSAPISTSTPIATTTQDSPAPTPKTIYIGQANPVNCFGGEIPVPSKGVGSCSWNDSKTLLVGHVMNTFQSLHLTNVGDTIIYNGKSYTVFSVTTENVEDIDMSELVVPSGKGVKTYSRELLSVMTCAGTPKNGVYPKRTIVKALIN